MFAERLCAQQLHIWSLVIHHFISACFFWTYAAVIPFSDTVPGPFWKGSNKITPHPPCLKWLVQQQGDMLDSSAQSDSFTPCHDTDRTTNNLKPSNMSARGKLPLHSALPPARKTDPGNAGQHIFVLQYLMTQIGVQMWKMDFTRQTAAEGQMCVCGWPFKREALQCLHSLSVLSDCLSVSVFGPISTITLFAGHGSGLINANTHARKAVGSI